jgi:hypothetical protein
MDGCWYTAQGDFKCNVKRGDSSGGCKTCEGFTSEPAWINQDAKELAWKERTANGFPVGASEDAWKEKHGMFTPGGFPSDRVAACQLHKQEVAKVSEDMSSKRAWCMTPP